MAQVIDVAKYLIKKSRPGTLENITNLKLQKLLYYSQGFHLAINHEPLFNEEIQAWVHGPVIPEIYNEFKNYSYREITQRYVNNEIDLSQKEMKLLDDVWEIFKSYTGKDLEEMTHKEAPWLTARDGLNSLDYCSKEISQDAIREYFSKEYLV